MVFLEGMGKGGGTGGRRVLLGCLCICVSGSVYLSSDCVA